MDPGLEEHFEAYEGEDEGQAIVEVVKGVKEVFDTEKEGAEAEDGKDVRRIDEKGVAGNGEDGGDRVEGKEDVARLYCHEGEKEGGKGAVVDEFAGGAVMGDFKVPRQIAENRVRRWIDLLIFLEGELDSGIDEEKGKEVEHPLDMADQGQASHDKKGAKDDGSKDAPKEHFMQVAGRNMKILKNEEKNEEIVDRQRLLDEVGGQKQEGVVRAPAVPDPKVKKERKTYPEGTRQEGLSHRNFVGFSMHQHVDAEEDRDHQGKGP